LNKLIKLLIITGISIVICILIYFAYSDSQFRYYIGTSTGLKDKPILTHENFLIEEVMVGIQSSTALTFIGNDILFLEKETGQIRHIKNNKLIDGPVWDFNVKMEGCECYTESGLLGITSFNSDVYVFVTEELGTVESFVENRIYKFNWKNDQLHNQTLLNILPGHGNMHHGGAMVADLNGNIFAVIGDQNIETELQNVKNGIFTDVGIILRVGLNNEIKSPSSSDSPNDHYHGVGIRNSFGLAIDPVTNNLWDTENGTHEFDEINLTFPKYNSGWTKILGPATAEQKENFTGYSDYQYSDPEFSWEKTPAPTGISFVDDNWKNFSNNIFVGDCQGNLYTFQLNNSRDGFIFNNPELKDLVLNVGDSNSEIIFGENFGCITDIEYSPNDQSLYVISYLNNGAIYKITPK
jgi:aldose sugar dehydrogenase